MMQKYLAFRDTGNLFTAITLVIVILLVIFVPVLALTGDLLDEFLETVITGLLWGGVYALIALGVVVVYRASKVFNMATGGMLLFLTYFAWYMLSPREWDLPLWAALPILFISAALLGFFIDRAVMRPMIGRNLLFTFFTTLVLGFGIFQGITHLIFGGLPQHMPEMFPSGTVEIAGVSTRWVLLCCFIVATVMFLTFTAYFNFTRGGLAMRCVSEDNVISQSLGINVKRIYAIAWVVGALLAAAASILYTSARYNEFNVGIGDLSMWTVLPVVLLGGMESFSGAYAGAIIISLCIELSRSYIDPHINQFSTVLPFLLILAILMIRPYGLWGLKESKRI